MSEDGWDEFRRREAFSRAHDRWLDPPDNVSGSHCPCEPCLLCGGKPLEHRRENFRDIDHGDWTDTVSTGIVDCFPGENDTVCRCRGCGCGRMIPADSPFDECDNCILGISKEE